MSKGTEAGVVRVRCGDAPGWRGGYWFYPLNTVWTLLISLPPLHHAIPFIWLLDYWSSLLTILPTFSLHCNAFSSLQPKWYLNVQHQIRSFSYLKLTNSFILLLRCRCHPSHGHWVPLPFQPQRIPCSASSPDSSHSECHLIDTHPALSGHRAFTLGSFSA